MRPEITFLNIQLSNSRVSFCRNNVNFILVYNEEKNPNKTDVKEDKSRFNLEKFEKLYFHAVYTYTESEFEQEFVQKYSIMISVC